jgi:hypothetical protein
MIRIARADLSRTETLPALCVRCGRKAAGFRGFRLRSPAPKRSSEVGCLLFWLGQWTWRDKWRFENILHEYKTARGKLKLPVCWRHRWLLPPMVVVGLVDEKTVALCNASDEFVAEMRKRGWVR